MASYHTASLSPELVATDRALGLITVACPRCGITVGIIPASVAWHARCGGVRMMPADPALAERMRLRAQRRFQQRRRRARRGSVATTFQAENPATMGGLEASREGWGSPPLPAA